MACGFGTMVASMLMLLTALGLTVAALITNYWFQVSTKDIVSEEVRTANNYHFGFWLKCFEEVPKGMYP